MRELRRRSSQLDSHVSGVAFCGALDSTNYEGRGSKCDQAQQSHSIPSPTVEPFAIFRRREIKDLLNPVSASCSIPPAAALERKLGR